MNLLENKWNDDVANKLSPESQLLYRSNLLGSDKRITNFGGGNTSSKIMQTDMFSEKNTEVLWVKGSGGDIGTMKLDGFATLYMDKLLAIKKLYKGVEFEDEMVALLPHCTFNLNQRAASIDTPLHAYLPYKFVDHMHPDAIIAIAASKNSKQLTKQIFKERIGWIRWQRPGYELGLMLEKFAQENPEAQGVILESHGLFTWADNAKQCYLNTIDTINQAIEWFENETQENDAFGGAKYTSLSAQKREDIAAKLMPAIRKYIAQDQSKIGHFDDSETVLEFVNSNALTKLGPLGTSCPDHFLRTKINPLLVKFNPNTDDVDDILNVLESDIEEYRINYKAYYDRCKKADSPSMRDPNAVVYLIPGVGMITFANDKATARISAEFYINAINVMRGAASVSEYVGLDEQEAFNIEYWLLEEAKLQRMPKAKSLAGKVALVTGGAGGIGAAVSAKLLDEGACILLADIDAEALQKRKDALISKYGADKVSSTIMNVTKEQDVKDSFKELTLRFGGIDILVSNAGISSSAPIEDTELSDWNRNMDILSTGYFLVSREAFRMMKVQNLGGAIVFVASKNGLAASPNAAAYCTAKAAEIHLARCLALEGAPNQIRVNTVNPDAVLADSKIWNGEWRAQRAAAYDMDPNGLEEHYRKRSLLKRSVLPSDIAAAAYFLVSEQSAKSTGNIINVDAGNAQSFTR